MDVSDIFGIWQGNIPGYLVLDCARCRKVARSSVQSSFIFSSAFSARALASSQASAAASGSPFGRLAFSFAIKHACSANSTHGVEEEHAERNSTIAKILIASLFLAPARE
jgi:hypothetical protein